MGCKLGTDFFSCLFEGSEDQIQKESEDQVQKEAAQKEAESVGPVDQLKKDLYPRAQGRGAGQKAKVAEQEVSSNHGVQGLLLSDTACVNYRVAGVDPELQ